MKVFSKSQGKLIDIPDDQFVANQISQPSTQTTNIQQPNTITGHTIQEHQIALQKARAIGDTNAIKQIQDDYDKEYQYQNDINQGKFDTPEQKLAKEEKTKALTDIVKTKDRNNKISQAAQDFINTYNDISQNGDINSEDAKRKLAFAAGKYNSVVGFGEGGKQLSSAELGILAPTLLKTQRQRDPNVFEKALGWKPELTQGLLDENPQTALEKAKLALQYSNPETAKKYNSISPVSGDTSSDFFTQLLKNAGKDSYDILNSFLNIPSNVMQYQADKIKQRGVPATINESIGDAAIAATKGMVNEYNQLLGKPLEGGDIVGKMGKNAYERPVSTILDLLPFLNLAKSENAVKDITPSMQELKAVNTGTTLDDVLNIPKKIGKNMRDSINNIEIDPGLNAAAREDKINTVVNKYTTGSPADKYRQIGPAAQKLYTDIIEPELQKNSKGITTKAVEDAFTDYLDKNKISLGTTDKGPREVANKFLSDVFTSEDHKSIIPEKIQTDRLFQLKQELSANNGMQRIFNKLQDANAGPLTDEEKVKLAAWSTLDDIIAKEHPNIKQATQEYGLLKEAAKSLSKSRKNIPNPRLFGVKLPIPDTRGVQDIVGKILENNYR